MSIEVKKVIVNAIVDLIRHKIFYGHILSQLSKVYIKGENPKIPTMAVGKNRDELLVKLFVNEDYVQKMFKEANSKEQAWNWSLGLLEHEVLHLVFDHLALHFSDHLRGSVAVDLVVNSCIREENLPSMKDSGPCLPQRYGFPKHESAYWYYSHLRDNKQFQDDCSKGAFGLGGLFSDAMKSHSIWEEAAKDPILKELVKDIVRQAKELCNKEYGNIPAEVIEQIDDILRRRKQIVPWQKVLRMFCATATESNLDYTMKRQSKRFGTRPGTRKEDVLNLAVGVDTSGSISDSQLVLFFNEIRWIHKNGAFVTIYECDCAIHKVYKFKGKFTGEVTGRGGTDLEPVLKEVEGHYDALIYFTDFYAPKIETKYRIPILWVLTTELSRHEFPYPWGRHIKIEDNTAVPA